MKEELAMKMYDDYCHVVGGKAFNGDNLPKRAQTAIDYLAVG
jgi:hypothetical protein